MEQLTSQQSQTAQKLTEAQQQIDQLRQENARRSAQETEEKVASAGLEAANTEALQQELVQKTTMLEELRKENELLRSSASGADDDALTASAAADSAAEAVQEAAARAQEATQQLEDAHGTIEQLQAQVEELLQKQEELQGDVVRANSRHRIALEEAQSKADSRLQRAIEDLVGAKRKAARSSRSTKTSLPSYGASYKKRRLREKLLRTHSLPSKLHRSWKTRPSLLKDLLLGLLEHSLRVSRSTSRHGRSTTAMMMMNSTTTITTTISTIKGCTALSAMLAD